jgi:hypothetical protein
MGLRFVIVYTGISHMTSPGYAPNGNSPTILAIRRAVFQPARRFFVQAGAPRAILTLGGRSAEVKESFPRMVG